MGFSLKKAVKNVGNSVGKFVGDAGKTIEHSVGQIGSGASEIGKGVVQGKWSKIEGGAKGIGSGYGKLYAGGSGGAATTSEQGITGVQDISKGILSGDGKKIKQGYGAYSQNSAAGVQGTIMAETIAGVTGGENLPSRTEIASAQQQQQQGQAAGGLPPTGLQQQLASLNSYYGQQGQAMGGQAMGAQLGQDQLGANGNIGGNSLDNMARNLAQRYGMPIGRGRLMDDQGNFLMMPDQVSQASGGALSTQDAAAKMNYISQAIARQQNEGQQKKAMAALQTGLGQVQSNARGSMSAMMSGYYQDIANLYSNQQYEAADFSYFIQKDQEDIAAAKQASEAKKQKKQGTVQAIAGIGITALGIYTGNAQITTTGLGMAAGGASNAGWF
jgi:hypothetical protein